jgi:RHS repeat-associated protein
LATAVTDGSTANPRWGLQWSYDRYGNRTNQQVTAGTAYNVPLSFDSSSNRVSGISFDPSGNLTQDASAYYKYDGENRLVDFGNGGATYTVDGNGLRVKRTYGSATVYIFNGSQVIAEYASGAAPANPSREYIYSGGLLASIEGGTTKYYLPDHLSTRMTMANGTATEQGHYPFGESWYGSTSEKWKFTSYERDPESGNDYANFRSYVNRYGRFLMPDPLGTRAVDLTNPQSWNRYTYTNANPVNAVDPLGLFMCGSCIEGGGGGFAYIQFLNEWSLCAYGGICGGGARLPFGGGDDPGWSDPGAPILKRQKPTGVSQELLRFLADCEGHLADYGLYNDSAKSRNCTVGIGQLVHIGPCTQADRDKYPNGMDQETAESNFAARVAVSERDVLTHMPSNDVPSQGQVDSMVSLAFNMGFGNAKGGLRSHDAWRSWISGNYLLVPSDIMTLKGGGPGIPFRRANEAAMFRFGEYASNCYEAH